MKPATTPLTPPRRHSRSPVRRPTLRAVLDTLDAVLDLVKTIHDHQHTLHQRLHTMDARIQAAFDAQALKFEEVAAGLVAEIDEVKALVVAIPEADPTEIVTAVDAATARLDALKANIAAVSDQIFPPATP